MNLNIFWGKFEGLEDRWNEVSNNEQINKLKRHKIKIGEENISYDCIMSGILLHLWVKWNNNKGEWKIDNFMKFRIYIIFIKLVSLCQSV